MSQLDYQIHGSDLQYIEVTLPPQAAVVGEQGAMMYMDNYLDVETVLGDGTASSFGLLGRWFKALKRAYTGESLFSSRYTNNTANAQRVAFAAPTLGKIVAVNLAEVGGELICQRGAFLAGEAGTEVQLAWQKRIRVGLMGGEGFIMQKLEGDGMAFCHAGGHIIKRTLQEGASLKIDTGCIVAYTKDIDFDIQFVGGIKNTFFGGEGIFFATLKGPGEVWLQTLPISRLASRVLSYGQGTRKEEGTGLLGGLGNLIDGD